MLRWYSENKRNLPWRKTQNPYQIWLSEIMLQQTQVDTVIPYYKKWLASFPTLKSVADVKEHDLLKVWEGLGYYNRCRNFHRAAKIVMKDFNCVIPSDYHSFRSLPGVGDYTAAAVLSICFDKPFPVMDGNVKRVMARVLKRRKLSKYNLKRIRSKLDGWIDPEHPGDFNQAMMELGSLVCRPNQPHCFECPLMSICAAAKTLRPEGYPEREHRKPIPHYNVSVGLIWKNDRFLILKRADKKHLGGLWELPGGKINPGESPAVALHREIREECGADVSVGKPIGTVRHRYSHFAITMEVFHCRLKNGSNFGPVQPNHWIHKAEIPDYPFPRANHKLFSLIQDG